MKTTEYSVRGGVDLLKTAAQSALIIFVAATLFLAVFFNIFPSAGAGFYSYVGSVRGEAVFSDKTFSREYGGFDESAASVAERGEYAKDLTAVVERLIDAYRKNESAGEVSKRLLDRLEQYLASDVCVAYSEAQFLSDKLLMPRTLHVYIADTAGSYRGLAAELAFKVRGERTPGFVRTDFADFCTALSEGKTVSHLAASALAAATYKLCGVGGVEQLITEYAAEIALADNAARSLIESGENTDSDLVFAKACAAYALKTLYGAFSEAGDYSDEYSYYTEKLGQLQYIYDNMA